MTLTEAFSTPLEQPTWLAIAEHVREEYLGQGDNRRAGDVNPHAVRRKGIEERLRYFRDAYEGDVFALVDLVFQSKEVRKQRRRLASLAMSRNTTKRIIEAISAVYDRPASRLYGNRATVDNAKTEKLRKIENELELHEFMSRAETLTNLCNEVLIWGEPSLRIITPDAFDVIPDPRDPLRPAGYVLDWFGGARFRGAAREGAVHWRVYDEEHYIELNGAGRMIGDPVEHGRGRMPGILCHRRLPVTDLLDADSGKDILSCHRAVVLLDLLTIRLSKSQGENQPVLSGPTAQMAKNQPLDGETPVALPPGVTASMLQMRSDPEHYLKVIRSFVSACAATYGMSWEQLMMQETSSTTSGRAYKVRREKLTEIRRKSATRWRNVEPDVMELLGLGRKGFSVNQREMAVPQDASDEYALFEQEMRQGLDTHVQYLMRKDPDLTPREAQLLHRANIRENARVISQLRETNTPKTADAVDPGRTPQENGADNQPTDAENDEQAATSPTPSPTTERTVN